MWDFISSFVREFLLPAAVSLGGGALNSFIQSENAPEAPSFTQNFDVQPQQTFETFSPPVPGGPTGPPVQQTNPTQGVLGSGSPSRGLGASSFTGGFAGPSPVTPPPTTGYSSGFGTLNSGQGEYTSPQGAKKRPGFYGV